MVQPRKQRPVRRSRFVFTPLPTPAHHHETSCECEPTVAYIRVSSTQDKEVIVSPEIQLAAIALDAAHNNRRIVDVIFDINLSGSSLEGRSLHRVVDEIKNGAYHIVSVWKWSRWGRNTLDSLQMILAVQDVSGQVVSATEAYDTKTPTGELVRDILLVIASWQGKIIGESWRDVQGIRRQAGLPHSGRNRFGYQYIGKRYVIDEHEASMLKELYERYVAKVSLPDLTIDLNARGFWTSTGGSWTMEALGKMLDTGFGAGYIRERSNPKVQKKRGNHIGNYDIWRVGAHEPIISEELWQRYRARREERAATPVRLREPTHALSGLMFCGICGRRLSTKYMGNYKTHGWVCMKRIAYHPELAVSISNSIALGVVRDWVRTIVADDTHESRTAEVTEQAQAIEAGQPQIKSDIDECLARLARVAGKMRRLKDAFIEEGTDGSDFQRRKGLLLAEERAVRADLVRARMAETKTQGREQVIAAFVALDSEWDRYSPATLHAVLAEVVGMVRVFPRVTRRRADSASRVEVAPVWEMGIWGDSWLSERRSWQSSQ